MQDTKTALLEATFKEIYQNGYQGTSLSKIMKTSKLTKGALYYYFKSKKAITLETLEVILGGFIKTYWEEPMQNTQKPFDTLLECIENFPSAKIFEHSFLDVKHGCLLNNMIQEMSPLDEDFSILLQEIYSRFENSILLALVKAQKMGEIGSNENIEDAALFVTAAIEACITRAKLHNEIDSYHRCTGQLKQYLLALKSSSLSSSTFKR